MRLMSGSLVGDIKIEKLKLKSAWHRFLLEKEFTHALTLTYSYTQIGEVNFHSIRKNLKLLQSLIDGKIYGKRYHLNSFPNRTEYVAFPTSISNWRMPHIHLLWTTQEEKSSDFEKMFQTKASPWQKIVPKGTHKLEILYNKSGWISYCLDQCQLELIVIGSELISKK